MPELTSNKSPALVLITGISGSGKSVALHALEDIGYYCVDNLPPELLPQLMEVVARDGRQRVAIAMDVRSVANRAGFANIHEITKLASSAQVLFLDASTESLVQRFSETRRRHPLSSASSSEGGQAASDLIRSIETEREWLAPLKDRASSFDTSHSTPAQLRAWIKQMVQAPASSLLLVFESFGFKRGLPMEADFVFDARMLPNPHYDKALRPLSGRDRAVIQYFESHPQMAEFVRDIGDLIERWVPRFVEDHRSYLTIAVGCTGGQHRSVYITEQLAARFGKQYTAVLRHRDVKDTHQTADYLDSQFDLSLGTAEKR